MEQFLCARGYSDRIAGFASSSYMLSLVVASFPVGVLSLKVKKDVQVSKIFLAVFSLGCGAFAYLITIPDHPGMIISLCIFMGTSARYVKLITIFFITLFLYKIKFSFYSK